MMANPHRQSLSKAVSEMKFMKRHGEEDTDVGGALTDKWVVPDVPHPQDSLGILTVNESIVEFEDLNRFGRFSFNNYNKEIERLMAKYKSKGSLSDSSSGEIEDDDEDETCVSALELAKRHDELTSGKKKQYLGKRKR
jgi:hypothetical protein